MSSDNIPFSNVPKENTDEITKEEQEWISKRFGPKGLERYVRDLLNERFGKDARRRVWHLRGSKGLSDNEPLARQLEEAARNQKEVSEREKNKAR